jgi:transcriptional regulator with XRE-family HTH domain
MKNIDNTLKELFLNLNLKQKKVINERFGLTCNPRTLQAIGDDLGVTRERVRQIESQSKNKIADSIEENFSFLINNAMDILDNFDGVCEYKTFIKEIKKDNEINELKNIDNKISFIFNIAKKPLLFKENEDFNSFWYKNKDSKNKLFNYINKVIKFFKKEIIN